MASTGLYRRTFAGSDAPLRMSRLVIIIRKRVEIMAMADALPHLMRCLMNGSQNAPRSRPDYERTMLLVSDMVTKKGDRIGDRKIKAISPRSADKIHELILQGPRGERPRQAEKAVALCRRAWRVVHRLYPDQFDRAIPNPWDGVTKGPRTKKVKSAVTRELVIVSLGAA